MSNKQVIKAELRVLEPPAHRLQQRVNEAKHKREKTENCCQKNHKT